MSKVKIYDGWTITFGGNARSGGKATDPQGVSHPLCFMCGHPKSAHTFVPGVASSMDTSTGSYKCLTEDAYYPKHDPRTMPSIGDKLSIDDVVLEITNVDENRRISYVVSGEADGSVSTLSREDWLSRLSDAKVVSTVEDPPPIDEIPKVDPYARYVPWQCSNQLCRAVFAPTDAIVIVLREPGTALLDHFECMRCRSYLEPLTNCVFMQLAKGYDPYESPPIGDPKVLKGPMFGPFLSVSCMWGENIVMRAVDGRVDCLAYRDTGGWVLYDKLWWKSVEVVSSPTAALTIFDSEKAKDTYVKPAVSGEVVRLDQGS